MTDEIQTRTAPDTGLLPCPFCGGEADYYVADQAVFTVSWVGHVCHCKNCQSRVQTVGGKDIAIAMWNGRTPGPAQGPNRDALRKEIIQVLEARACFEINTSEKAADEIFRLIDFRDALGTAGAVEAVGYVSKWDLERLRSGVITIISPAAITGRTGEDLERKDIALYAAPSPAALDPATVEAMRKALKTIEEMGEKVSATGALTVAIRMGNIAHAALIKASSLDANPESLQDHVGVKK